MELYEMSQEYSDRVKGELDEGTEGSIYNRIVKAIKVAFEEDYYCIEPDDLEILSSKLRKFAASEDYRIQTRIPEVGLVTVFDFYKDVCDVFKLIAENIEYKDYNAPILTVNVNSILCSLSLRVGIYLNREKLEKLEDDEA